MSNAGFLHAINAVLSLPIQPIHEHNLPDAVNFTGKLNSFSYVTHQHGTTKCDRAGHKFDMLRCRKATGETDHFGASVRCRRCGCVYDYIPVRRAELNLHPQATQQSRKHWLKEQAA